VTGHTGFKGAWLCKMLTAAGAEVTGFALDPPTAPSVFDLLGIAGEIRDLRGDVADFDALKAAFDAARPEIVLHLAAQPLVRRSYEEPVLTYRTNVMGTVNLLECVRLSDTVRSVVNVTTDKVYKNNEWCWGYRENDLLDGFDPYSNSKSCSELVTRCYRDSFFTGKDGAVTVPVSAVRAGNVIGGGDFAENRIIPDCVRAAVKREDIIVRNPASVRPFQHVLEPLNVYLMIAAAQLDRPELAGCYNVGPDDRDCAHISELTAKFAAAWGGGLKSIVRPDGGPHEANYLKLDCARLRGTFGWKPVWTLDTAVQKTAAWYRCWHEGGDLKRFTKQQINEFLEDANRESVAE
jgi:CDP-glucose 4,6-dehydratase